MSSDLCVGCGACAVQFPQLRIEHVDGRLKPVGSIAASGSATFGEVCPGVSVSSPESAGSSSRVRDHQILGNYVSLTHGHAREAALREAGASGGVITAVLDHLLESGDITGAAVTQGSANSPLTSEAHVQRTPAGLRGASGSRYAPGSALLALSETEEGDQIAFVGRPCEVSALRALQRLGNVEAQRVSIVFSFFCAGVPTSLAAVGVLDALDVAESSVTDVAYRDGDMPGEFVARSHGKDLGRMSYEESWGKYLGRDLPLRCKVCPDGFGEHADVSFGDFWDADDHGRPVFENSESRTAIVARTSLGERVLADAVAAAAVVHKELSPDLLLATQQHQVHRKRTHRYRLLGLRVKGTPELSLSRTLAPDRVGFLERFKSFVGALIR